MCEVEIECGVDLGFAEKFEDENYGSNKNPYISKLGGKPFWVSRSNVPSVSTLKCGNCFNQMTFLCQLYVPSDNEIGSNLSKSELFINKIFYLFCCNKGSCYSSQLCVKVLRFVCESNGSDENFQPVYLHDTKDIKSLCNLCGCYGDKKCSKCSQVFYCCKEHQLIDWKFSHKKNCYQEGYNKQPESKDSSDNKKNPFLFDEYEIVIENEPSKQERLEKLKEKYKKYENYMTDQNTQLDKQLENDLKKIDETNGDKMFLNFKERIECEPEQIVRYELNGEPLWVSSENIPKEQDIPLCKCGSKRQFEFQILPQMLNYLGVETTKESIDWGTLVVYTCQKNCVNIDDLYVEEFVWKQDFSNENLLT
ncbi:programmed cell death protein 2 isoform X1 [Hydra vulgaris]|nr:programmed cell death protein 2 [Hydra vulgaris]